MSSRYATGNIRIGAGLRHRTSCRLEPEVWEGLAEIARATGRSRNQVCADVAITVPGKGLASALRMHVLRYYRAGAQNFAASRPPDSPAVPGQQERRKATE